MWQIYDFVGRDEIAHTRFYQGVVKVLLEEDREGTLRDIAFVARNFKMPAEDLIEDYHARIEVMRATSGIDRNIFLQKVYFPVLKQLGVTRADLVRAIRNGENASGELMAGQVA